MFRFSPAVALHEWLFSALDRVEPAWGAVVLGSLVLVLVWALRQVGWVLRRTVKHHESHRTGESRAVDDD